MMRYRKCGNTGLYLPEIALGLWQNFGTYDPYERSVSMVRYAFEQGVTHFDLANNYGPEPGSAELTFGRILKEELSEHRDQMIISTKAGHLMWNGPYGDGGSRKYLMASIDQSLRRLGIEYVDIFYSHRYVTTTPLEETLQALVDIVRQGKALYVGISKYPLQQAAFAIEYLRQRDVPCLIHQDRYSMLSREPETHLMPLLRSSGVGMIAFSALAQGLLSDKYLHGIPQSSRLAKQQGTLSPNELTPHKIELLQRLNTFAQDRGMTLAQLALKWVLRDEVVCSTIVGTSSVMQIKENLQVVELPPLTDSDILQLDEILTKPTI